MALAATDFTIIKRIPLGNSAYMVIGKYKGPASYTGAGEILTQAKLQAGVNLTQLYWGIFGGSFQTSTGSYATQCVLDTINVTGTQQAKIHFYNGLPSHTHDITLIGGLTSSEPVFADAAQSFGKTAATNRNIVGSTSATTGGVKSNSGTTADEITNATDLSSETCSFCFIGV